MICDLRDGCYICLLVCWQIITSLRQNNSVWVFFIQVNRKISLYVTSFATMKSHESCSSSSPIPTVEISRFDVSGDTCGEYQCLFTICSCLTVRVNSRYDVSDIVWVVFSLRVQVD